MATEPSETASTEEALSHLVPGPVVRINQALRRAGFRCWLVGGSVRDLLRQKSGQATLPKDWDLATDARPGDVQKLFRRVIPTGIEHGTVTVLIDARGYEVTTLRGERGYSDGRHPDEVFFVSDIVLDLSRRDFTVNAMAYDLDQHRLEDPFGGLVDLERRVLRAVGDASQRFLEDGLRVMRCARFCSTLELEVDSETRAALRPALSSLRKVAVERIREEWLKALESRHPSLALNLMQAEGILDVVFPDLYAGRVPEKASFEAMCEKLDRAGPDPLRRLALICCDGRGATEAGSLAMGLARRLKFSGEQQKRLGKLVTHCEPPLPIEEDSDGRESLVALLAFRRWLCSVGRDALQDVLAFLAEHEETGALAASARTLSQRELAGGLPLSLRELRISGQDLIQASGRSPGPWVGRQLDWLFQRCLEDPSQNDPQALLALLADAPSD